MSILGKSLNVGTISLSLDAIIDLIEGNMDLGELLELIPNPSPAVLRRESRDVYDEVKQRYVDKCGAANIYFASRSFVDWADPVKRGITWTGQLIVTEGASASQIMEEVENKLREEAALIIEWLPNQSRTTSQQPSRESSYRRAFFLAISCCCMETNTI